MPETAVRFTGSDGAASVSADTRSGLPDRVAPGVTYTGVRVGYTLATRLGRRRGRRGHRR